MLTFIVSMKIVIRLWSWYKLIQVGTRQTSLRASSVGKHLLRSPPPEHQRKLARSLKPVKLSWLGIYNLTLSTCRVFPLLFSLVRHLVIKIWRAIVNFSNGNGQFQGESFVKSRCIIVYNQRRHEIACYHNAERQPVVLWGQSLEARHIWAREIVIFSQQLR